MKTILLATLLIGGWGSSAGLDERRVRPNGLRADRDGALAIRGARQ